MTRVLLTGAGGFIGHHTLEYFLQNTAWDVVCLDSFRHRGVSSRLRLVLEANPDHAHRVNVISHDLTSPIDKVTAHLIGPVDVIVNMASESHVDRSIETPRSFIENNVMLALSMLDYARSLDNLKLFIQVSTDEVYGPVDNGEGPHKEYDSMLPSNPYSASKASQEAIAIAYWKTYDLPVVITNTMNNIGERQDPEKFVPKTIKSFLTNAEVSVHGRVVEDVWYPGTRHYLDARNYASALIFIINRLHSVPVKSSEGVTRPHRYHIPGEREVSNLEMVELICKHLEADPSLIKLHNADSSRPGYDKNYGLDPGTLKTLGWTPPFTFEESIERVINWSAKNPHWLE